MTTEIRDGVKWYPWRVRYAAFGDKWVSLSDNDRWPGQKIFYRRYTITASDPRAWCSHTCGCGKPDEPHGRAIGDFDSLDEALATFHEAEERLLRGEL